MLDTNPGATNMFQNNKNAGGGGGLTVEDGYYVNFTDSADFLICV